MYIPPNFTVITCEPVSEEAFRVWTENNGGVWQAEESLWNFPSGCEIIAYLGAPCEKQKSEWTPRMHAPPQSIIDVFGEHACDDAAKWTPLVRALFSQWDGYAYDRSVPEYIRVLLRDILPPERIIRYEPPPLSAGPAWIWADGKYTRNEAYYDNIDAVESLCQAVQAAVVSENLELGAWELGAWE